MALDTMSNPSAFGHSTENQTGRCPHDELLTKRRNAEVPENHYGKRLRHFVDSRQRAPYHYHRDEIKCDCNESRCPSSVSSGETFSQHGKKDHSVRRRGLPCAESVASRVMTTHRLPIARWGLRPSTHPQHVFRGSCAFRHRLVGAYPLIERPRLDVGEGEISRLEVRPEVIHDAGDLRC